MERKRIEKHRRSERNAGTSQNTKPQKMKGIREKENVKRRERGTAVEMGECIFPANCEAQASHPVVCRDESLISTFFCPF